MFRVSVATSEWLKLTCGLNQSMQHLFSDYRGEDVENEVSTADLLQ